MADNKNEFPNPEEKRRDPNLSNEEKEILRRAEDGSGRDPTARRGEIEEGGSISDADTGEDRLK